MSKKLLHKTSGAYILYSLLILMIAAPVFYYATEKLYLQETDDTLQLHKNEFVQYNAAGINDEDIWHWNTYNRNIKIEPATAFKKDSLYNKTYYDTLDAELEPYRELRSNINIAGKKYIYIARQSLVESKDVVKQLAVLFIIIIILLLTGLFIITKKLSKNLWKPFYKTLQQIESFEIDKATQPGFTETGIEEFNRLNTSIIKLVEKNTRIYKNQQEFIENAAHELQTPLAVFQAKIDSLAQRTDVTQAQAGILHTLNENVSRLKRLNKNLLLLSKMDNEIYNDRQTVSLTGCIEKQLDFFAEQAQAKNVTIQLEVKEACNVHANQVLVNVLISNLFLNAIKHNVTGGRVNIDIHKSSINFSNSGQTESLNTNTLFNRFSKANSSDDGTGLGLSIIKKIADINGWQVLYNFANGLHSFSIVF